VLHESGEALVTKKRTDDDIAADITDGGLSTDELWLRAKVQTHLLLKLLDPQHRRQSVGPTPYWMMVGLTVGRLEKLTRELSVRDIGGSGGHGGSAHGFGNNDGEP
jgi:hypothetical protein